jgi:drug/metabolite transporter (DMT)-like permease
MLLTFSSLSLLPLAEATAFNFTAPIFATLLSAWIIGERIGLHRWSAVLVGFLGVLLMLRVTGSGMAIPASNVGIALMAALAQALVTITLRKLQGEHVAAIVFWFVTAMSLAGAMMLPFYGQMHDSTTFAILLGAGVFGAFAQLLMTASLAAAPVSVLMPFDYLQFLGATLLGWFLFSSLPNGYTFAGAAVIAGGGIYTAFREHRGWRSRNGLSDCNREMAVCGTTLPIKEV